MVAVPTIAPIDIRVMCRDDIPAVMRVEAAAYEFPWTAGIFRDCINVGHECRVAVQGASLVGHAVMSFGAGEAHLLNLCIAPALQGCGHGRHLLRRMIDLARWHGTERIFLEVRPTNTAAIHIYCTAGFTEVGRRSGYYPARAGREDAVVMALDLVPARRET